jgi:hypothetical protein
MNNRSSTQLRNAAAEADVLADRAERALKAARARAGEEVLSCTAISSLTSIIMIMQVQQRYLLAIQQMTG